MGKTNLNYMWTPCLGVSADNAPRLLALGARARVVLRRRPRDLRKRVAETMKKGRRRPAVDTPSTNLVLNTTLALLNMPSLSETGSEGMPTALPPPESMTVVLSARDACQPQNARGSSCREGAALRALQRCACAYPLPQPLQINAHLLVSKRRRRRELEHELVTGGRHELEFEHVDRMNSCRESRSG